MWRKPSWLERWIAGWLDLLDGLITILSLAQWCPAFGLKYRCHELDKRIRASAKARRKPKPGHPGSSSFDDYYGID